MPSMSDVGAINPEFKANPLDTYVSAKTIFKKTILYQL